MRSKEEAFDYRYFPDPDLLPVRIEEDLKRQLRDELPELPDAKFARFRDVYGLSSDDAAQLSGGRELADFFEAVVDAASGNARTAANWMTGEFMAALNREGLEIVQSPVTPAMMGEMIRRIDDRTISGKLAKQVFDAMWRGEGGADAVIDKLGLRQITDDSAIEAIIDQVIAANPGQCEAYRSGKDKLFGFFVGQVMKASKGKANPNQVNDLLRKKLQ